MSKYAAIEAFARGLMSALLREGESETKAARPAVVKTEDVERACASYIDKLLAQSAPAPQQMDLGFEPPPSEPGFGAPIPPEMQEVVRDTIGDLGTIPPPSVPGVTKADEERFQTYDPNMPGEGTWQSPRF